MMCILPVKIKAGHTHQKNNWKLYSLLEQKKKSLKGTKYREVKTSEALIGCLEDEGHSEEWDNLKSLSCMLTVLVWG